jgi:phage shock protein C
MTDRFLLNPAKGKVMGVCAGLADRLKIDVLAVRLATIVSVLVTGPVAILLYVLTGWLATDDR